VLTSVWFVRKQKKQAKAECDERLADYQRALHEGIEIERTHDEDHQTH